MKKKISIICIVLGLCIFMVPAKAQLLKKIKQKAEQAIEKKIDKADKKQEDPVPAETNDAGETKKGSTGSSLKVYSKFDFVPGSTVLYFDNFEKDNIGEAPEGWITNSSAEVVNIEGLEGKWVKMASDRSNKHFTRSKKQSWGNNFTIEFDLLLVKDSYDPRITLALVNTGGNLVTDESILRDVKKIISFSGGLFSPNQCNASLYGIDDKTISSNGGADLPYNNTTPVHISICVQGKRFRMWWNEKKLFDAPVVSEQFLPNQFSITSDMEGFNYYASNFRIAKDVPDTRAKFEEGKLVSNLLFFTGTAKLKPESLGALLDVSKVIKEATEPVKIVGHTDSDGDEAANQKLSQERAETVKSILQKEYGVDESKMTTEGRGETQPMADNSNAEGKAQNRRVEFIFKPEADKYVKPDGIKSGATSKSKAEAGVKKTETVAATETSVVTLQSKILTVNLPYAQFIKKREGQYTFIAGKEEGNGKENYFKIELETANTKLKPETFNFDEINRMEPLYGTKKFSVIKNTEAVLYYGGARKPYIYKFSPVIANGHMADYVTQSLAEKLPPPSPNCKLVIEKLENGKARGYFVVGIMIQGLKPITKGDAMQETFTNGFSGEMKCTFSNVPVY